MIRRKHSLSLRRATTAVEEDVNPNAYLTNLADCMLVMTVGLLVALVARYGVDLQETVEEKDEYVGLEVTMDADGDGIIDPGYEETGTVYRDSATGKLYFVQD